MGRTHTIYGILLKDQIYESWIQKGEKTTKTKKICRIKSQKIKIGISMAGDGHPET